MRSVIAIIVGGVLLVACSNKTKVPKGILPLPKMEQVVWDMLQADRFVNEFVSKPGDTVDHKLENFAVYQKVFNVHGISREQFLESYKFYLSRPDLTRTLFDSITAKGERRRAEIYETPQRDSLKRRLDSLRNSRKK